MAIILSGSQIQIALPRVEDGLNKYLRLQNQVKNNSSFFQDPNFRRQFNHFYRVRRGNEWQDKFYLLMNKAIQEKLNFHTILNQLYEETSRVEASFASKLYATVNPSFPVIDSVVLKNLGLRLPYAGANNRITKVCQIHASLTNLFNEYLKTLDGISLVKEFDLAYPDAKDKLTNQKKLDLVLWQTR